MAGYPGDHQVFEACRDGILFEGTVEVDSEFVLLKACCHMGMCPGINVRVNPYGYFSFFP